MEAFLSTFWTLSLALQTRMTDARFCEVDRPKKDTHTSIELSCSSSSVTDMADVVLENPAEACTECGGEGGRIQAPCECVPSRNDLLIWVQRCMAVNQAQAKVRVDTAQGHGVRHCESWIASSVGPCRCKLCWPSHVRCWRGRAGWEAGCPGFGSPMAWWHGAASVIVGMQQWSRRSTPSPLSLVCMVVNPPQTRKSA